MNQEYNEFLKKKQKVHIMSGFDIDDNQLNSNMFDFQKFEVYQALKMGRNAIGFELKESYFDLAKKNIESVILSQTQASLF